MKSFPVIWVFRHFCVKIECKNEIYHILDIESEIDPKNKGNFDQKDLSLDKLNRLYNLQLDIVWSKNKLNLDLI